MKLNILIIEGEKKSEKEKGDKAIRSQAYFVTELFLYFFRRIDLDGSDKLVIYFCDKPDSEEKYKCVSYFQVSTYYVDEDVIKRFYTLKQHEISEFFLDVIVKTCSDIAIRNGKPELIETIEQAAEKVREIDFDLTQHRKNISKLSPDKKYKANVYRRICRMGEIWYVEMVNKEDKSIIRHELMKNYVTLSQTSRYNKSFWEGNKFTITSDVGMFSTTIEV